MRVIQGFFHPDGSVGVLVKLDVMSVAVLQSSEFQAFSEGVSLSLALYLRYHYTREVIEGWETQKVMKMPWVAVGNHATIGDAFEAAAKQFGEPMSLYYFEYLHA